MKVKEFISKLAFRIDDIILCSLDDTGDENDEIKIDVNGDFITFFEDCEIDTIDIGKLPNQKNTLMLTISKGDKDGTI